MVFGTQRFSKYLLLCSVEEGEGLKWHKNEQMMKEYAFFGDELSLQI